MKCNFCEWRCDLEEGGTGVCGHYTVEKGMIKEIFPHQWTTLYAVHIESLPFYHAYPGSRSLLLGSSGCNFDCSYCVNSYIAREAPFRLYMFNLTPKKIIKLAQQTCCHNIIFGVNEPVVSLPSLQELAVEAKAAGLPMGCLTNGFMTEEATEIMRETFSFINISLKSLKEDFYRRHVGPGNIKPILRNIRSLARTNHVEITTPIIQSVNDQEIDEIAAFIHNIDPEIPWHVFRLLPEYKMKECRNPSIEEINLKLEKARRLLPYIYFSNFVGSEWVNTLCPDCGRPVIERVNLGGCGGKITNYFIEEKFDEGKLHESKNEKICPYCGRKIRIFGERLEWNSLEENQ